MPQRVWRRAQLQRVPSVPRFAGPLSRCAHAPHATSRVSVPAAPEQGSLPVLNEGVLRKARQPCNSRGSVRAEARSFTARRLYCWVTRSAVESHARRNSTASNIFTQICPKGACRLPPCRAAPFLKATCRRYQISQYDEPLAEHGAVDVALPAEEGGGVCRVRITRAHLEEARRSVLTVMRLVRPSESRSTGLG